MDDPHDATLKKNASEEENAIGTNPVLTVYRYSLRVWHFLDDPLYDA
jgi:hypothetical protein